MCISCSQNNIIIVIYNLINSNSSRMYFRKCTSSMIPMHSFPTRCIIHFNNMSTLCLMNMIIWIDCCPRNLRLIPSFTICRSNSQLSSFTVFHLFENDSRSSRITRISISTKPSCQSICSWFF